MPSLTTEAQRIADLYQAPAVGRLSELADAETVSKFLQAIADGNYVETACRLAGIAKPTVYRWLKEAEDLQDRTREPHRLFRDAMEKAQGMAEALAVARVRKAGEDPRFWAAEMTFLERRHPDRWARRSEDNNAPKVVVQIGVRDSDVRVELSPGSPAPSVLSSPLALDEGEAPK